MAPTYPVSIAPMMDRTDRHYRWFMRQITRRTLLYTEMVVCHAIIHGDRDYLIGFDPDEHPLVLQLGGDDPAFLAECARIAEQYGYDELNLNVGCPSARVKAGAFGVSLMGRPEVVAEAVRAMKAVVSIPVTVKHRTGFDDKDSYAELVEFVRIVSEAGADRLSVHARKAWLNGLSPKENRNVPPLRYDWVHQLKADHSHLQIEINGGIKTLTDTAEQLRHVDAVMIGRAAYDNPWLFADVDERFFGAEQAVSTDRRQVVHKMIGYVDQHVERVGKLSRITRHMLNLFAGQPGTKAWKRVLSTRSSMPGAGSEVLLEALSALDAAQARFAS